MTAYIRYPYVATLKDTKTFWLSFEWCLKNLKRGLWTTNYEKPNSLKFTIEEDYILFLLNWS